MSQKILIPTPNKDFDPTEAAIPWKLLCENDFEVHFATPDGRVGEADHRMLTGKGLGIWAANLKANSIAVGAYQEMAKSREFQNPISYSQSDFKTYDGIVLPGGHASGMKVYLESEVLQKKVAEFFSTGKPVGAICHGVVLAARSKNQNGKSILYQKQVTALPKWMELSAWAMTCLWLGSYYRTYPQTVEGEVREALGDKNLFDSGPMSFLRDNRKHLSRGFCMRDGNLVTARWPGDAHRFACEFMDLFKHL